MDNDFERFVAAVQEQGFRVRFTSAGHAAIYADGILAAVLWDPFDDISLRYTIRRMRKLGFVWPPPKRD